MSADEPASISTLMLLGWTLSGKLWLVTRDLAIWLFGITMVSPFRSRTRVARQLISMTCPSLPPSTLIQSRRQQSLNRLLKRIFQYPEGRRKIDQA